MPSSIDRYLTLVEKQRLMALLHHVIEILHIGKHNVGALAAELQRAALEVRFGAGLANDTAHFDGAREPDLVHQRMAAQRRTYTSQTDKNHMSFPSPSTHLDQPDQPTPIGAVWKIRNENQSRRGI